MLKLLRPAGVNPAKVLLPAALFLILFVFVAATAYGAGNLSLSTSYPGVTVQPGGSITFPLTISGLSGSVDLKITSKPAGWTAGIYGDGMKVHRVYVPAGGQGQAELRVQIPQEAKNGSYDLVVEAASANNRARLPINLRVSSGESGADRMEVQYPSLSGPDTASFNFRATLYNNSGRARFYSLGARAPEGWQVSFKPAYQSNQITSLSLEAGRSQDLDIIVEPPKGVKAGKYTITAAAVSGNETAKADLEVVISGTYRLDLTTPSGRLNADVTAGRKGSLTLQIENKGSADLQGISFSADAPPGWAVTFDPAGIDRLKSGEKRQVTAFITPDGKAIAGDYVVSLTASASETSANADIRVTVHTSTLWGLVGALIVVGVISWVGWTFNKYGRR